MPRATIASLAQSAPFRKLDCEAVLRTLSEFTDLDPFLCQGAALGWNWRTPSALCGCPRLRLGCVKYMNALQSGCVTCIRFRVLFIASAGSWKTFASCRKIFPSLRQVLPGRRETLPDRRETLPGRRKGLPGCREALPSRREIFPNSWKALEILT